MFHTQPWLFDCAIQADEDIMIVDLSAGGDRTKMGSTDLGFHVKTVSYGLSRLSHSKVPECLRQALHLQSYLPVNNCR